MRKSIFDIINKDINLYDEFEKLKDLSRKEYSYEKSMEPPKTIQQAFDTNIKDCDFRGTYSNFLDMVEYVDFVNEDIEIKILYLIELIVNIHYFLVEKEYYEFSNSKLIGNCRYIVEKLQYKIIEKDDRLVLETNNIEVIDTVNSVEMDLGELLIDYCDFRIINDEISKSKILSEIAKKMEGMRRKLKDANEDLEKDCFNLFNALNIRHNNKEGEKKKEVASTSTSEELIKYYDMLYSRVLVLLRLKKFKEEEPEYKKLISTVQNSSK